MFNLSDNYNLRKYYFQHDQVPSQCVMREKMSPALASVYFNSMTPRCKILAGLEPPLKGGVLNWFVCPKTVLKGKAVLKPIDHQHVTKINHHGVTELGLKVVKAFKTDMLAEKKRVLTDSDNKWKGIVNKAREDYWQETTAKHKLLNSEYIRQLFKEFTIEYKSSLNKIEKLLNDAAKQEIKRVRKEAFEKMKKRYRLFLKSQATTITEFYRKKLIDEQTRLKTEFMTKLELNKANTINNIHDLNVDKHEAIENLRIFLECQNLACQIYVSLKEQEKCNKEMELCKYDHEKKLKTLTDDIAVKNITIKIAEEIEKKQKKELDQQQQKLCKVIKRFVLFVTYCLRTLPEYAEFFINMEKLMLLQINETMQNPYADSIVIEEPGELHPPSPKPSPFYLFCDRGYKAQVNQDLCPSNRASNASQLPVIVVNQRCIYAACDNFDQLTEKVKNHVHGKRGDDADIRDDFNYDYCDPVKYTTSQQLTEMKLESSLLQILQQETASRKETDKCESCGMPSCYCTSLKKEVRPSEKPKKAVVGNKTLAMAGPSTILEHEREPNLERYLKYVEPQKCSCGKLAKKHLKQNLPAYMTNTTKYEDLELLNYKKCPMSTLKQLVKQANGQIDTPPVKKILPRTKNVSTQYSDIEFDFLCSCFSNSEELLVKDYIIGQRPYPEYGESSRLPFGSVSPSYLQQQASEFATDRAQSLRRLLNRSPELRELFRRKQC